MRTSFRCVVETATVVLLSLSAWHASAGVFSNDFSVIPPNPRYMEPVYLHLEHSLYTIILGSATTMEGNRITVSWRLDPPDLTLPGPYELELGRFPAGTYVVDPGLGGAPLQFTVAPQQEDYIFRSPSKLPPVDYSDMWFDPARPGWGLSVAQRPNGKIFVAWFVFSANGDPTWYTFEPPDSLGTDYNGPVYKTIATSRAAPFIPDIVSQAQVGTASLHFADHNHATFRYTVEGISGTADITRLPFEE